MMSEDTKALRFDRLWPRTFAIRQANEEVQAVTRCREVMAGRRRGARRGARTEVNGPHRLLQHGVGGIIQPDSQGGCLPSLI